MSRVMVVEGDQALRASAVRPLVLHGFDVSSVSSRHEALQKVCGGDVGIIVTSLSTDPEVVSFLRDLGVRVPFVQSIVIVDSATEALRELAQSCGAVCVLEKPLQEERLLDAVREAEKEEGGFRGFIHGVSLLDLFQIFHYARRCLIVTVNESSRLYFEDGEIVHAENGEAQGEVAVRQILQLHSGRVRTSAPRPVQRTVERSFQSLILDCLREADEFERDSAGSAGSESLLPLLPLRSSAPSVRASIFPGVHPSMEMVQASCVELSKRVEGCLGVALVDLASQEVLALHWSQPGDPTEAIKLSTASMFRSQAILALDRVLSGVGTGVRAEEQLEEIRLASPSMVHLAKRLVNRNAAVVMLAEKLSPPAVCWAELRQTTHTIERILA